MKHIIYKINFDEKNGELNIKFKAFEIENNDLVESRIDIPDLIDHNLSEYNPDENSSIEQMIDHLSENIEGDFSILSI